MAVEVYLFDSIIDPQYRYTIAGTVTNSLGSPMQTYVVLINPGDGNASAPSVEAMRVSKSDGSYAFPLDTPTPRTVLCVDYTDVHSNDIVFGKVVPG